MGGGEPREKPYRFANALRINSRKNQRSHAVARGCRCPAQQITRTMSPRPIAKPVEAIVRRTIPSPPGRRGPARSALARPAFGFIKFQSIDEQGPRNRPGAIGRVLPVVGDGIARRDQPTAVEVSCVRTSRMSILPHHHSARSMFCAREVDIAADQHHEVAW